MELNRIRIKELQERVHKLESNNDALETELLAANNQAAVLEKRCEDTKQRLQQKEKELSDAVQKVQTLSEKVRDASRELQVAQDQRLALQEENSQLQSQLASQQAPETASAATDTRDFLPHITRDIGSQYEKVLTPPSKRTAAARAAVPAEPQRDTVKSPQAPTDHDPSPSRSNLGRSMGASRSSEPSRQEGESRITTRAPTGGETEEGRESLLDVSATSLGDPNSSQDHGNLHSSVNQAEGNDKLSSSSFQERSEMGEVGVNATFADQVVEHIEVSRQGHRENGSFHESMSMLASFFEQLASAVGHQRPQHQQSAPRSSSATPIPANTQQNAFKSSHTPQFEESARPLKRKENSEGTERSAANPSREPAGQPTPTTHRAHSMAGAATAGVPAAMGHDRRGPSPVQPSSETSGDREAKEALALYQELNAEIGSDFDEREWGIIRESLGIPVEQNSSQAVDNPTRLPVTGIHPSDSERLCLLKQLRIQMKQEESSDVDFSVAGSEGGSSSTARQRFAMGVALGLLRSRGPVPSAPAAPAIPPASDQSGVLASPAKHSTSSSSQPPATPSQPQWQSGSFLVDGSAVGSRAWHAAASPGMELSAISPISKHKKAPTQGEAGMGEGGRSNGGEKAGKRQGNRGHAVSRTAMESEAFPPASPTTSQYSTSRSSLQPLSLASDSPSTNKKNKSHHVLRPDAAGAQPKSPTKPGALASSKRVPAGEEGVGRDRQPPPLPLLDAAASPRSRGAAPPGPVRTTAPQERALQATQLQQRGPVTASAPHSRPPRPQLPRRSGSVNATVPDSRSGTMGTGIEPEYSDEDTSDDASYIDDSDAWHELAREMESLNSPQRKPASSDSAASSSGGKAAEELGIQQNLQQLNPDVVEAIYATLGKAMQVLNEGPHDKEQEADEDSVASDLPESPDDDDVGYQQDNGGDAGEVRTHSGFNRSLEFESPEHAREYLQRLQQRSQEGNSLARAAETQQRLYSHLQRLSLDQVVASPTVPEEVAKSEGSPVSTGSEDMEKSVAKLEGSSSGLKSRIMELKGRASQAHFSGSPSFQASLLNAMGKGSLPNGSPLPRLGLAEDAAQGLSASLKETTARFSAEQIRDHLARVEHVHRGRERVNDATPNEAGLASPEAPSPPHIQHATLSGANSPFLAKQVSGSRDCLRLEQYFMAPQGKRQTLPGHEIDVLMETHNAFARRKQDVASPPADQVHRQPLKPPTSGQRGSELQSRHKVARKRMMHKISQLRK